MSDLNKEFADRFKVYKDQSEKLMAEIDSMRSYLDERAAEMAAAPKPTEAEMQKEQQRLKEEQRQQRKEKREKKRREKHRPELALGIINSGYRQTAKKQHPDLGGTAEGMHELQEVKELLIAGIDDSLASSFRRKRR
jgi:Skp family chaperone for outer membrane proteins